jgi:flavodoxin
METIHIIYASQTGNSENSADALYQSLTASHPYLTTTVCRMDDYITSTQPTGPNSTFPDYLILITSSYGYGQPPLGGEIFRATIDKLMADSETGTPAVSENVFEHVNFSMLGHGSRSYPTFFQNPRVLKRGLSSQGGILLPTPSCEDSALVEHLLSPDCDGVGVADSSSLTPDFNVSVKAWINAIKDCIRTLEDAIQRQTLQEAVSRRQLRIDNRQMLLRVACETCPDEVSDKRNDFVKSGERQHTVSAVSAVGMCRNMCHKWRFILFPLAICVIAVIIALKRTNGHIIIN